MFHAPAWLYLTKWITSCVGLLCVIFCLYILCHAHVLFLIIKLQPITSDEHITIQAGGRILQIKAAQISDTGRYSCVASNIAGEDELEFDVNIQGTVACVPVCREMAWCCG